jgi:ribosome-associated translation inhibitor RaiA
MGGCSYCVGMLGLCDRILNEISDQLRRGPSICRGQPLDTVPQRGRNPDRYRTKLVIHQRLLATARGCRRQQESRNAQWSITMPDMPKTTITNTDQTHELTAIFNDKIERLEKQIERLERKLETAHSLIRKLEEALAVATSR